MSDIIGWKSIFFPKWNDWKISWIFITKNLLLDYRVVNSCVSVRIMTIVSCPFTTEFGNRAAQKKPTKSNSRRTTTNVSVHAKFSSSQLFLFLLTPFGFYSSFEKLFISDVSLLFRIPLPRFTLNWFSAKVLRAPEKSAKKTLKLKKFSLFWELRKLEKLELWKNWKSSENWQCPSFELFEINNPRLEINH